VTKHSWTKDACKKRRRVISRYTLHWTSSRLQCRCLWFQNLPDTLLLLGREFKRKVMFFIFKVKNKVKFTLVQALRLCTGRTTHRGSRGIALLFHDCTTKGWGVSVTPRPLFTPGKDPVPIVQEAGWAAGPVWTSAENLSPTEILSPDRQVRSQSLYRLNYSANSFLLVFLKLRYFANIPLGFKK
jgi:hypothetical protein